MVRKVLFVLCLFTAVSAFAATPEEMIKAQAKAWMDAFNAADAKALGALYGPESWLMPPNAPAVKGPEAIAAFMAPFFAGDTKLVITVDTTELAVHGDVAHRLGTWVIKEPDGKVVDKGKYVELWKKSGDAWVMGHDIWNSDMPVAPSPAK